MTFFVHAGFVQMLLVIIVHVVFGKIEKMMKSTFLYKSCCDYLLVAKRQDEVSGQRHLDTSLASVQANQLQHQEQFRNVMKITVFI